MDEEMRKTESRKPMKVLSKDRQVRKGIVASTFEDFSNCCKEKFDVLDAGRLTFVLEEDGTEVDSCYWDTLPPNTKLVLLQGDDVWEPAPGSSGSSTDSTSSATASRVMQLMEKFKQKKAAKPLLGQKKNQETVTVVAGWQHFSYRCNKYQIMKSTKKHFEIGPRPIHFQRKSSYAELKENLKTTFFPNGKNFCGKISKMHSKLGNAKGDTIEDNPTFTLGSFVDSCTPQKPRIYLLTKTQLATFESESSDSDFSLPDLGFEYTALNSTQHRVSNPLHTVATAAVGAPTESLLSPAVLRAQLL